MRRVLCLFFLAALAVVFDPGRAEAYIGPGAGFAVGGSFLAVFAAVFSALAMILSWPVRLVWRILFRKRTPKPPRFQRVVVLGLDGLDYGLTQQFLDEGLRRQPDSAFGQFLLGSLSLRTNKPTQAEIALLRAIQLDPTKAQYRLQLVNLLLQQGRKDAAASQLRDLLAALPDSSYTSGLSRCPPPSSVGCRGKSQRLVFSLPRSAARYAARAR